MRLRSSVIAVVVSALLFSSTAMAQQRHVVDPVAMRLAVADQAQADQANRDAVLTLLDRSEVRELASRFGLSLTRAENSMSTLSSEELASLADSARIADVQLAGGADRIVLSVTTLLLIVIIAILVAR